MLRKGINDLLDSEELIWQQRSKVQWLGLEDCNTKYFHSKASKRRKKNTITRLKDEEGNWCDSNESIASVVVNYFEKLYTTSFPNRVSKVIETILVRVTNKMNQELIKEFSKEEVAMWQHPASIGTGWKNYCCRCEPSFDHLPWQQLLRARGPVGGTLSNDGVRVCFV